ncbi:acylphosphatase-1-like isoform X1 [Myxocyprinus asiaticus]|uniref:acylphosphatase-1-like isoform X1 n=2 Tax=Myxocyprinus asiaticus TaxID=70543 RepID=UPI0022229F50|nr:acylphosphatase-1-like isoform X1 [Myxocyprinus asiaticus]
MITCVSVFELREGGATSCLTSQQTAPHINASLWQFTRVIMSAEELLSVDYEVYGRVQGVFFRKYTQSEGKKLGLVGWVQNTDAGTVQGQLQGPVSKVQQMQQWLQTTGSPQSRIAKAEFKNERTVDKLDFKDFKVVR